MSTQARVQKAATATNRTHGAQLKAPAPSSNGKWDCGACTFRNESSTSLACDICATPRSTIAPPPSTARTAQQEADESFKKQVENSRKAREAQTQAQTQAQAQAQAQAPTPVPRKAGPTQNGGQAGQAASPSCTKTSKNPVYIPLDPDDSADDSDHDHTR